ncbi:FHA domain-containing protein, partial [Mycobacterium tuberculosis]
MQGLVQQLTRAGFLMLLWVFIWSCCTDLEDH